MKTEPWQLKRESWNVYSPKLPEQLSSNSYSVPKLDMDKV